MALLYSGDYTIEYYEVETIGEESTLLIPVRISPAWLVQEPEAKPKLSKPQPVLTTRKYKL